MQVRNLELQRKEKVLERTASEQSLSMDQSVVSDGDEPLMHQPSAQGQ